MVNIGLKKYLSKQIEMKLKKRIELVNRIRLQIFYSMLGKFRFN